jgi:PKD repeat protein
MKTSAISRLLCASLALFILAAALPGSSNAAAPAITAPATASAAIGIPIATITATATDADAADVLTITQSGKPASLTFTAQVPGVSPRTATITGTLGCNDLAGSPYSIVWTVNDGAGGTGTATTVLTIATTNRPPSITAPATASGTEGVAIATIMATATDAECGTLTITQAGKPVSLTFTAQAPGVSPRTATITGTPGFSDAETYNIVWTVTDGAGGTGTATTVLTIANTNRQPAITAPATASGTEGTALATITATAFDADAADVLTITQAGKPASLTFTAQAPGVSPRTATISGTPAVGSAGAYNIVWTVTGGTCGTANATTVLTIANCSGANGCGGGGTVIRAPATASGTEGVALATITATATDPDAANTLTITQAGMPADLTFTAQAPGVSPRTATITGTPGFTDAGTYNIVWTVTDGVGGTGSATTVLTIFNVNRSPVITAPATACEGVGSPIATITATATDPDAGDILTITQAGKPADLTFTAQAPGVSPRTATITGTPGFTDAGNYNIVWTVNDGAGGTVSATTVLTIGAGANQNPVITAPATASGVVGSPIATITATATDADVVCNGFLTITQAGKPADLVFTAQAPGVSPRTATITGTPGFGDAGTFNIMWMVNDGAGGTASATTVLTISSPNRCPFANPGGPYSGIVSVPVAFDGTASSDPDGSALSYAWDFDASDGVGIDATGPTPSHTYDVTGTYVVTLTVSDGLCGISRTTTTFIGGVCPATVFNGYDVIRLGSGKPTWFAFVQPMSGCYSNADVVLSSFVLKYAGKQIPADVTKTTINTDKNGDGIEEIRVSFSKANLRILFSGTGLANGHNIVTVTIEANLTTGGRLQGTTEVDVFNNGDFSAASISPNPLNPQATLTFTTARAGFARIELFDIGGRLVRTILEERSLASGTHEVKVEGRGQRGETLASGIYFIRGVSADGTFTKTIAILK